MIIGVHNRHLIDKKNNQKNKFYFNSTITDAAINEYNIISQLSTDAYKYYIQSLIFLGVAGGAIITLTFKLLEVDASLKTNEALDYVSQVSGVIGFFSIMLIHVWIASWSYLNAELWAHRSYLMKLEEFIKKKYEETGEYIIGEMPYNFYSTRIVGIYDSKASPKIFKISAFKLLNMPYIFCVLSLYTVTHILLFIYGYSFLQIKNGCILNSIRICFIVISLILLVTTLLGKKLLADYHIKIMPEEVEMTITKKKDS